MVNYKKYSVINYTTKSISKQIKATKKEKQSPKPFIRLDKLVCKIQQVIKPKID